MNALVHRDPVTRSEEAGIRENELRWQSCACEQRLWTVEVRQHGVEQRGSLDDRALDTSPLLAVDRERHEVHQPGALLALRIRVDVVGDAVGFDESLPGFRSTAEFPIAHPSEHCGEPFPLGARASGGVERFVPVARRWRVSPLDAPGARLQTRVGHVCSMLTLCYRSYRLRPCRRKSRVDGNSGFSDAWGTSEDPGVCPNGKKRALRLASASLEFTGKVS